MLAPKTTASYNSNNCSAKQKPIGHRSTSLNAQNSACLRGANPKQEWNESPVDVHLNNRLIRTKTFYKIRNNLRLRGEKMIILLHNRNLWTRWKSTKFSRKGMRRYHFPVALVCYMEDPESEVLQLVSITRAPISQERKIPVPPAPIEKERGKKGFSQQRKSCSWLWERATWLLNNSLSVKISSSRIYK